MAIFQTPYDALVERQRTLNEQQNPALRKARGAINWSEEMPGALTSSGVPDMFEGQANKEFWQNNDTLRALEDPGSGAWRRSAGNLKGHVGTIGDGGMNGFDVVRGMSSFGNVNTGPSSLERDMGSEALHAMRLANYERGKAPETRVSEAVAAQEALGRSKMGLESENLRRAAQDYFDPTVAAAREASDASTVDQLNARWVEPAKAKAEGERLAALAKAQGAIDVQKGKNAMGTLGMVLSGLNRTAGTMALTDQQAAMLDNVFQILQSIGVEGNMIPQGLVPSYTPQKR